MRLTCVRGYARSTVQRFVPLIGRRPVIIVVGVLSMATLALCLNCRPKPPDLTTCTRVEVRYGDGALNYFFPSDVMQKEVLNEQEGEYVRSYDAWTATDQKQIKAFAYEVSRGTYSRLWSLLALVSDTDTRANIVGYRPRGRKISFSVHGPEIMAGRRLFTYPCGLSLASLDPPGLTSLQVRWRCALNLISLLREGLSPGMLRPRPHLDPNHWCDTTVDGYRKKWIIHGELGRNEKERTYPDAYVAKMFTCPSVHPAPDENDAHSQSDENDSSDRPPDTWTSNYAMNSNCRADSPEDMVFLFESKPGWNQHGGPELFTFDNHDPKGGLVLLNDGTVKFIRTEEELKQLRWK
jgi:uncharacterized protein YecT (DUF1311 family)